jgi:O-antigen/teichoic acid export membrane protein
MNETSAIETRAIPAPAAPVVAGLSWRQIVSWTSKGSLAIADQGLFAGSNFLLNVLLARWLAPADYGAFALAYSVFLLLGVFHTAILTEPMLVFGPGKYRERFPEYLGILLRGHFALMLPGAALLAATAFLLGWLYSPAVGRAFLALALAGPFILLLWLLRRAFYVRLSPGWSAVGGGVYLAILLASILTLHPTGRLTPATGFLAMAAASLITCLILFALLRPKLVTDSSAIRAVAADHWRYGKWAVVASLLMWVPWNVYYLAFSGQLDHAAELRALMNVVLPTTHVLMAISSLALPSMACHYSKGGLSALRAAAARLGSVMLAFSALHLATVALLGTSILDFLYHGRYKAAPITLYLAGVIPTFVSGAMTLAALVRAIEQPRHLASAFALAALVSVALGVPASLILHINGALVGIIVAFCAAIGVLLVASRQPGSLR